MKKVLILCLGLVISLFSYADVTSTDQSALNLDQNKAVIVPNSGDDSKVGLGSGDDLDTLNEINEVDSGNDNPETDEANAKI